MEFARLVNPWAYPALDYSTGNAQLILCRLSIARRWYDRFGSWFRRNKVDKFELSHLLDNEFVPEMDKIIDASIGGMMRNPQIMNRPSNFKTIMRGDKLQKFLRTSNIVVKTPDQYELEISVIHIPFTYKPGPYRDYLIPGTKRLIVFKIKIGDTQFISNFKKLILPGDWSTSLEEPSAFPLRFIQMNAQKYVTGD